MGQDGAENNGPGRFAGVRALFFDLDGTLIDSKLDLAISVNATLRHMGRGPLADDTIFGYVGNGAQMLVQRALGEGVTAEESKRAAFFLAYYREHMLDNTVAYPGVREGLELLKGRDLAVLTNKPVRFSEAILEGLGLAHYFRYVYGGNSFETKKPDPEGVNTLLRRSRDRAARSDDRRRFRRGCANGAERRHVGVRRQLRAGPRGAARASAGPDARQPCRTAAHLNGRRA